MGWPWRPGSTEVLALLLGGVLAAHAEDLTRLLERHGPPSRSLMLAERARDPDEPLLVYWMRTEADPLGLGAALPGTLVVNLDAATGRVQSQTFLAMASDAQKASWEAALRARDGDLSTGEEERPGGRFRWYRLSLEGGGRAEVSVRLGGSGEGMADGRPSPDLWVQVEAAP